MKVRSSSISVVVWNPRGEPPRELVLRLLRRRLGELTPALEQRVRGLQVAQLESLAEALLDFTGTADLQKWLQALQ